MIILLIAPSFKPTLHALDKALQPVQTPEPLRVESVIEVSAFLDQLCHVAESDINAIGYGKLELGTLRSVPMMPVLLYRDSV